ncbi:MAG TPA: cache domain-containing protein, partial [Roseiflexaceae bacterium]|nr:cache domain-containing protein [Roseiflexaceae bacterium]
MPFFRAIRLSIRAKVLLLALGLALPPLIAVSLLGLSNLNLARQAAEEISTTALRDQAEDNLARRAADKALLYNTALDNIKDEVEEVASFTTQMIADGQPMPINSSERVWIPPNGPTEQNLNAHAAAVARARQVAPILRTAVERRSLVSLAFVGLEDGGVSAFDHDIIDTLLQLDSFDVRGRPWYVAARDAGRTVWVDTYVDANTGKLVTTCATPFYTPDNQFVGVIGFDLLLDTIQQDLLQLDMGSSGYAFLINDHGKVLVRPDMSVGNVAWNQPFSGENLLESSDPTLRAVVQRMVQGEKGVERLRYQQDNVYLAFAPIENAGWSVGIVIPEHDITRPAEDLGAAIGARQDRLRTQSIVLLAVSIGAVLILGGLLALLLTRPLLRLQAGAQRLA